MVTDGWVEIECDRCHQKVMGQIDDTSSAGVYVVEEGWCWSKFARPGERIVCDSCMWADPRYIKIYGKRRTK